MFIPRYVVTNEVGSCHFCRQDNCVTNRLIFGSNHGTGRVKNICKNCRAAVTKYVWSHRDRRRKDQTKLHLPSVVKAVCPCGLFRSIPVSLLDKYACSCCRLFSPCNRCVRYVLLPSNLSPMAVRTHQTVRAKHQNASAETKDAILNEAFLLAILTTAPRTNNKTGSSSNLPPPAGPTIDGRASANPTTDGRVSANSMYGQIRADFSLAKDVSVLCVCCMCGVIACADSLVFSKTKYNFVCPQCVFLTSLNNNNGEEPLSFCKFVIAVFNELIVPETLQRIGSHLPIKSGDSLGALSIFHMENELGMCLSGKGRDDYLAGTALMK